jgi:hypothetical protein
VERFFAALAAIIDVQTITEALPDLPSKVVAVTVAVWSVDVEVFLPTKVTLALPDASVIAALCCSAPAPETTKLT